MGKNRCQNIYKIANSFIPTFTDVGTVTGNLSTKVTTDFGSMKSGSTANASSVYPSPAGVGYASGGTGGSSAPQPVYLVCDGQVIAQVLGHHLVNEMRWRTGIRY